MARERRSISARLQSLSIPEPNSGCHLWIGSLFRNGYGAFNVDAKLRMAHRVSYETFVGPIPAGLAIDHLCRTKACINPGHLEPVSTRTNVLRGNGVTALNAKKTHCSQGHPYSGDNLKVIVVRGLEQRLCRACRRAWATIHNARRAVAS